MPCLPFNGSGEKRSSEAWTHAWRLDPVSQLLVCNPVLMFRNHDLMLTQAQSIMDKVHLLLKLGHLETHTTPSLSYQLVKDYS